MAPPLSSSVATTTYSDASFLRSAAKSIILSRILSYIVASRGAESKSIWELLPAAAVMGGFDCPHCCGTLVAELAGEVGMVHMASVAVVAGQFMDIGDDGHILISWKRTWLTLNSWLTLCPRRISRHLRLPWCRHHGGGGGK